MSCVNKALRCIHFFNYWLFCRLIQTGETLQCSRPCHKLHIQFTKLNFLVSISSTLNSHVFHMNFFFLVTFGFEQTFVQKICAFNIDEIDDWYLMSNRFISIQSNYVSLFFLCFRCDLIIHWKCCKIYLFSALTICGQGLNEMILNTAMSSVFRAFLLADNYNFSETAIEMEEMLFGKVW
jgi:hypothetical protein